MLGLHNPVGHLFPKLEERLLLVIIFLTLSVLFLLRA